MASYVYDDFRVTVTPRADGGFDASAVGSDGVVHAGTFRLPYEGAELERAVLDVASHVTRSVRPAAVTTRDLGGDGPPPIDAEDLGGALAGALLAGDVATAYDDARRRAVEHGRGLRLTLSLGAAPQLMSVPWELLYRRPTFLANQRQTPLVRHLDVADRRQPPAIDGTVHVLGVVASPADCPPLNVELEKQRVEQAMAKVVALGRVDLTWLDPATPRRLREVLRDGTFHVLHYVGHGAFTDEGEGVLFLEAPEPEGSEPDAAAPRGHAELDSTEMANLLADQTSLRLVVLNSCEGARTALTDPYAGVATTLIQLGVPAVVAMQFEISDKAAILFADELYTNLIGRQAPIDAAVSEARKAILIEQKTAEWATPVLFMSDVDVDLFRFEIDAAPLPPPPPPKLAVPEPDVAPAPALAANAVAGEVVTKTIRSVGSVIKWSAIGLIAIVVVLLGVAVVAGAIEGIRGDDDDATASTSPAGTVADAAGAAGAGSGTAAPSPGGAAVDVEALAAPQEMTGSIDAAGASAAFPVDLVAGQNVYISSDSPCGPDLRYQLDDPSGALASGYAESVCLDIGTYTAKQSGTHVVRVTGNGAATGDFSLVVTPVRADRDAELAVGETAVGNIDEAGAFDWYMLDLAAGDILYLDGRGTCGADLRYQLYSPSTELLLGFDRSVCQDGGRVTVTEDGQHGLGVYGVQRATGAYGILVAPVRPDRVADVVSGQSAAGTIDVGANDVYTLDLAIGDRVSLEPHAACGADLRYKVSSPSGALPLGYDFRTCDPGSFTATEAGPHTITVYGQDTATGPYDLAVTVNG